MPENTTPLQHPEHQKNNEEKKQKGQAEENTLPLPEQKENSPSLPSKEEGKPVEVSEKKDAAATEKSQTADSTSNFEKHDEVYASSSEDEEDEEDESLEDEFYGIPVKAYDEMNIEALGEELARLLKAHPVKKIRHHVREIKAEFDTKFGKKREAKKQEFLNQGGSIIDFHYSTPGEKKFNKFYFEYKEKRDNYYKNVRKNLQENLERRLSIIEELKAITGVGTDMNANFKEFKKLQERWRKAGPVPRNDYKDTWNTYHHHVERFYDFLHLDREFRELDYKHNLEQKLKMIGRAEELTQEKDVNRAFRELQNLHRMWKEDVGPVPKEYSDDIWERFSAATKKIHKNRRAHFEELDKKREQNLKKKEEIIEVLQNLKEEKITSHRSAQNKIKKFKKLREQFFNTGRVPRAKNQEIWDTFKSISREFNHKKNEFYKNRKKEQKENYKKKLELIQVAEENKDSDDFERVTPIMKRIQSDWKKIGYVPRKKSDAIWKQFQKACNHYFDRLHARQDKADQAALENYKKKKDFLDTLKTFSFEGNREENITIIKNKIETWKKLGAVPRNKKHVDRDFNKVLDTLFKKLDFSQKEADLLKYENRLQALEEADDDRKIQKEASFLHKKIDQTRDEIRQLETNLNFFDVADKNNPLMKTTYKKIDRLKRELQTWKGKLKKLKRL